jgi:hypothetical protein
MSKLYITMILLSIFFLMLITKFNLEKNSITKTVYGEWETQNIEKPFVIHFKKDGYYEIVNTSNFGNYMISFKYFSIPNFFKNIFYQSIARTNTSDDYFIESKELILKTNQRTIEHEFYLLAGNMIVGPEGPSILLHKLEK